MTLAIEMPAPATRLLRRPIYLQAGQLIAVAEPAVISTILGSCVAVCLWDERKAIGGMNHYMLPFQPARQVASPRFGSVAFEQLLQKLAALGARRDDLRAGIFGGACVMEAFRGSTDHVGVRNVELAEEQLATMRITVAHRAIGGHRGRKLIFETDTGSISVKEL